MLNIDPALAGRSVYLREPVLTDATEGDWYTWFNDYESVKYTEHVAGENTRKSQIDYFNGILGDTTRRVFAVCEVGEGRMIGVVSLQEIDTINRRANVAVMIGDRSYRSGLAGLEAVALITRFGFDELKLHKISAGTHELLRNWVDLLGSVGYRMEAEIPDHFWDEALNYKMLMHACYVGRFRELELANGELDVAKWARSYFKLKKTKK